MKTTRQDSSQPTLTEQVADVIAAATTHRGKRRKCAWSDYEMFKAKLDALRLAPRHYQRAIMNLLDALGL